MHQRGLVTSWSYLQLLWGGGSPPWMLISLTDILLVRWVQVSHGGISIDLVWWGLGISIFFYYGKKIHHKSHHLNRVKPTILTTCTSLRNRSSVVFPLANLELYTYETVTLQSPLSQLLPSTLLLRLSESDSSEHLLSVDSCSACLSWLAYFS